MCVIPAAFNYRLSVIEWHGVNSLTAYTDYTKSQ